MFPIAFIAETRVGIVITGNTGFCALDGFKQEIAEAVTVVGAV